MEEMEKAEISKQTALQDMEKSYSNALKAAQVHECVCMYVCLHVFFPCMYCMSVCMYVCKYVCMHVITHT